MGRGHIPKARVEINQRVHWAIQCTRASFASVHRVVWDSDVRFIGSDVARAGKLVNKSDTYGA